MENPISYASASGMQKRDAVIVLNKYIERFRWNDDDEVLDFGCGPGDITRHLLAECIPRSVLVFIQMSSAPLCDPNLSTSKRPEIELICQFWSPRPVHESFDLFCFNGLSNGHVLSYQLFCYFFECSSFQNGLFYFWPLNFGSLVNKKGKSRRKAALCFLSGFPPPSAFDLSATRFSS
jgi:hypothetical protein